MGTLNQRGPRRARLRLLAACASLAASAIVVAWLVAVLTPIIEWIGAVLAWIALFAGLAVLAAALIVRAAVSAEPPGDGATIDSLRTRQS